jgi:hypothetical protein
LHTVAPLIGIASKNGPQEPVRKGRTDLPFPIDATALLFGVMTFSLILLMSQYFLADPDTYWHITTGKWILVEGRLPRQDIFSHSILGKSWVDLEWLAQIILSVTYDLAGWVGLVLLCGAFVSVTFVLLYKFLARELRATVAMGASAVALVFALPHFLARPHLLTLPIIAVWTALLSRASAGKRRPSLWLLPLMTLWANLHGGFTLGLFLAVGFALEATFAARPHERRRVAVAWLGFCIGALAAGCITPYGYDYILETYHTLALGEVLNHIGEMRPMNPRSEYQQELILLCLVAMGLIFGVRIGLARVAIIVVLLHFTLQHVRGLAILAIVLPLIIAHPLQQQFPFLRASADPFPLFDMHRVRPLLTVIALLATLVVVGLLGMGYVIFRPHDAPPDYFAPAAALDYAIKENVKGPVLNHYDFGGYLIFRGVPTFIDGRTLLYGKEFSLNYFNADAPGGDSKLDQLADSYHVTWTLLRPQSAAALHFDNAPGWQRIYADDIAVVHVRH